MSPLKRRVVWVSSYFANGNEAVQRGLIAAR